MNYRQLGILIFTALISCFWFHRERLERALMIHLPFILGLTAALLLGLLLLPIYHRLRERELRRVFRDRLSIRENFPSRSLKKQIRFWGSSLNSQLRSIFRRGPGQAIFALWLDGGFDCSPLSFVFCLTGTAGGGLILGSLFLERVLLSFFVTFLLLIGFFSLIYSRARLNRRRFQDQFPDILDRLADSLQAGFSLPQAVEFVAPNLPHPGGEEMQKIAEGIKLGFTLDQTLHDLYERRTNDDVRLLVEGLTLQKQVGGNMALMMREMAALIRRRVELKDEVKTLTAQGRLSAIVIAFLVPVSLGLLSFFPGYTDVLFFTTIGNLVLIAAGILELLGAALVSRLIRIEI